MSVTSADPVEPTEDPTPEPNGRDGASRTASARVLYVAGDSGSGGVSHGARQSVSDTAADTAGNTAADVAGGVAEYAASLNVLLAELRRRGQRVTTVRRAVAEAVVAAQHRTAEEIVERVQREHHEVHPSTVYRTLETFEEAGLIEHVHFGHGPARWLLANDASHHLVCEACGLVQQVPRHLFDVVRERLEADYGFAIDLHHFANVGRCATCATTPALPS